MKRLHALALVVGPLFVGGCSKGDAGVDGQVTAVSAARTATKGAPVRAGIASLPNTGELLRYDGVRRIRTEGAATLYAVTFSEKHAYAALAGGDLVLSMPQGDRLHLHTDRHEEHSDGNWTLAARDAQGNRSLLTFGQDAVFGSFTRADGSQVRVTTMGRQVYLVEVDPRRLAYVDRPDPGKGGDTLVPPARAIAAQSAQATAAVQATAATDVGIAAVNDIDVLVGYSNGIVSRVGSESGAATLMQNLVSVANEAYANSGVTMRLRLVRSMLVNYPDTTDNTDTLQKLTGSNGSGTVPVDPAFNALRAARETYGADLVSLVRQFRDPEQDGCGVAWMLGGGQSAITPSDAAFAYSVISDGSDNGFGCRSETFAHELGHNMGQVHNNEDSLGSNGSLMYGAHAYSFGFRETSPSGFYTVMAYRQKDSAQFPIRYFANPAVSYNGRPTGVANQSDNARSLNQTMPIIAAFRAETVPSSNLPTVNSDVDGDGKSDLLWRHPDSSSFAYWLMNGPGVGTTRTVSARAGAGYRVVANGDFNADGRADLVWTSDARDLWLWSSGGVQFVTEYIGTYPAGWSIVGAGDVNGDLRADLFWHHPSSGQFAYWLMNRTTVVSTRTVAARASSAYRVAAVGDFNGDRKADLMWTSPSRDLWLWQSNGVEFSTVFVANYPLGWTPVGAGDLNVDGRADLLWRNETESTMAYWQMNGASVVRTATAAPRASASYRIAAIGDYDGDGDSDLIWTSPSRDLWMWSWTNTGFSASYVGTYPSGWVLEP